MNREVEAWKRRQKDFIEYNESLDTEGQEREGSMLKKFLGMVSLTAQTKFVNGEVRRISAEKSPEIEIPKIGVRHYLCWGATDLALYTGLGFIIYKSLAPLFE
jgi:hypothetical protein